jgi:hypothetical protein
LLFLLPIIFSLTTYGQDTLAIVELKIGADDLEVFFEGDTMFTRLFNDPAKTAVRGSLGAWYVGKTKFAEVDLKEMQSDRLLGVQRRDNITYFYSYRGAGKKTAISVYRSDLFGPATHSVTTTVSGIPSAGFIRNDHFAFFVWDRKASTVRLLEYKGAELVVSTDVKIPLDLKTVREGEVSFIAQNETTRITPSGVPLKLFIDGNTIGAVYDDIFEVYDEEDETKTLFKTHVFRKDLLTGQEDIDVIFSTERYAFKGFLYKDHLYRFASCDGFSKLTVHDLDQNKVLSEFILDDKDSIRGFERIGSEHNVSRKRLRSFGNIISYKTDVGLIVDEHKDNVIVTAGFIDHNKGEVRPLGTGTMLAPIMVLSLVGSALMQLKDDPNYTFYTYLSGSPETNFKVVPKGEEQDFAKIRMDEFDAQNLKRRNICYAGYFASKKYWLGVYRACGSRRYIFVKFDKTR